jgi:hypothetical protein
MQQALPQQSHLRRTSSDDNAQELPGASWVLPDEEGAEKLLLVMERSSR